MPLKFAYDAANRRTLRKRQGDTFSTAYQHDDLDRLIKVTDPSYNTTAYAYNWRGQVTQQVRSTATSPPGGAPQLSSTFGYDPTGLLQRIANDIASLGRASTETDLPSTSITICAT